MLRIFIVVKMVSLTKNGARIVRSQFYLSNQRPGTSRCRSVCVAQVNRSSLLVPEQVTKPQEVNGTNGSAALPVADPVNQTEPSTDSEEEEGGDTDDPGTSKCPRKLVTQVMINSKIIYW